MRPTVILIPGINPKGAESIFDAIRGRLKKTSYEVLKLGSANVEDLLTKAREVESRILVGKSYGGKIAIDYQLEHKDAEALVLLAPAAKAKEQYWEIEIPVLIVHGTEDRVISAENSRKLRERFKNSRLVEMPGADHGYKGKELETAEIIADWINSLKKT